MLTQNLAQPKLKPIEECNNWECEVSGCHEKAWSGYEVNGEKRFFCITHF